MAPNFEETITKARCLEEQRIRHSRLQLGLETIFQETGNIVFYYFFFHHKKGNTISLIDTWTRVTTHDSYGKKMIHAI